MSLLKSIKQSSIELFISYHPLSLKIKREAKLLHNSNKNNSTEAKSTLMQCQNDIVKKYGFNNWHHFLQTLKNQYNSNLDDKTFIVKENYEKLDNCFYLGYDYFFKNYKYQDISSSRTHRFIYGADIYNKYDIFFAKQSIRLGHSVFFINNDDDSNSFHELIEEAKKHNRNEDIVFFTKNNPCFIEDFSFLTPSCLTEIFISLNSFDKENISGEIITYTSALFLSLKQNEINQPITLKLIKDNINTNDFLKEISPIEHIANMQISLLNNLENNNMKELIDHYRSIFVENITRLETSSIFSNHPDNVKINFLEQTNSNKIYLLQGDNFTNVFFANLFKCSIFNTLSFPIEDYMRLPEHRKQNKFKYDLYFRNVPFIRGLAVLPAQARAIGCSINFSHKHLVDFHQPEFLSIFANTNTKIISSNEIKLLELVNKYLTLPESPKNLTDIKFYLENKDNSGNTINDMAYIISKNSYFSTIFSNDYLRE